MTRVLNISAATIFPPSTPLISPSLPPDRCSHTTTASQLFMGPACFDFKYLPRRRLFWSGEWGGGEEEEQSRLETHIHVLCVSLCMYTHTHTPVWAEVEDWFVLFLSQQDENTNIQQGERKQFTDRSVALFMKIS